MEAMTWPTDSGPVLKDWMQRRNCSASPRQFVCFYLLLVLVSCSIGLAVALCGAWLVLPFTGIELLAVGVAFIIYARHAVDYEYIRLCPDHLLIRRVSAGSVMQFEFNPCWVRIEPGREPRQCVTVASGRVSVSVGRHLAFEHRAEFARELRAWLKQCTSCGHRGSKAEGESEW
ncbi:DUF2244 domain-containing protein [Mycetohabitans rhizoxinica]|uniref:DUF2244 domain-containing protein n=1 Tax=Mycetohabitans rhizoxinica TaxID=412963 RepID=UPI0030D2C7CF